MYIVKQVELIILLMTFLLMSHDSSDVIVTLLTLEEK